MKILIASDSYKLSTNGITSVIISLSDGLRRLGHEVKVLSLSNDHHSFRDGDDYYIRSEPALYYPDLRVSFARKDPLIEELIAWKPDVIHLHSEGSALRLSLEVIRGCGAPLVQTCHTYYEYYVFGRLENLPPCKAFSAFVGGKLYRHASAVTVPSQKAANFPFLSKHRGELTVVPNGIELEKYRNRFSPENRRAFRESLGVAEEERLLVTVTRLSREKNIQELISLLPALLKERPGVKLLLVGDGPYRKKLESLSENLNLQNSVIFAGRIPSDEVWRHYAAGDIYVSASLFEVHSMSHLEALANGLPLLCRADDSLLGVLDHEQNGFIWNTPEEFTKYACRLLEEEGLREKMALRSLEKSQAFSVDAFASGMIGIYEKVIRESNQSET